MSPFHFFILAVSWQPKHCKWTHLFQFNLITQRFIASRMRWQPFYTPFTFAEPSKADPTLGPVEKSANFVKALESWLWLIEYDWNCLTLYGNWFLQVLVHLTVEYNWQLKSGLSDIAHTPRWTVFKENNINNLAKNKLVNYLFKWLTGIYHGELNTQTHFSMNWVRVLCSPW